MSKRDGNIQESSGIRILWRELEKRKVLNSAYSKRAFARDLGFSAPYVSHLMSGRKRLTAKTLGIISKKLSLPEAETDALALEIGGISRAIRTRADLQDVVSRRVTREREILNWRTIAILEYLETHHKDHSPQAISRRLGIDEQVAAKAIQLLIEEGLIKCDPKRRRRLVKTEDSSHFASVLPHSALRAYHKELLELGARAVDTVDPARRPIGSVAFAMDPSDIPELQARWRAFRKEIENFVSQGKRKTEVYVSIFECFPLLVSEESL